MSKHSNYRRKEEIIICHSCGGCGKRIKGYKTATCSMCKGSGRLKRVIKTKIEPYEEN